MESGASAVNVVNVVKGGENTNGEDIQDASHYPSDVCHILISTAVYPLISTTCIHSEKSPDRPMLFYSKNYWHQI